MSEPENCHPPLTVHKVESSPVSKPSRTTHCGLSSTWMSTVIDVDAPRESVAVMVITEVPVPEADFDVRIRLPALIAESTSPELLLLDARASELSSISVKKRETLIVCVSKPGSSIRLSNCPRNAGTSLMSFTVTTNS